MGAWMQGIIIGFFKPLFLHHHSHCYVLYIYWNKGISWLIPLITLFYKDGHGDKAVHMSEIENFGLAMLYHIKN